MPKPLRKTWVFIASCYFYMVFKPIYLLILFAIIGIDFIAGKRIEQSSLNKRMWLLLSISANLGILFFFKYFNFFSENINSLFQVFQISTQLPFIEIVLPIGLSFHTFQAMSYTFEVYRGKQQAERNLLDYAIYVLYFPQLVAGPIERPQNLLPQIKNTIFFNSKFVVKGVFLISIGMFKKVVIADRLALLVDPVFNNLANSNGLSVLVASIFFAFEIYCDFSGYSYIAIGVSKMMGIDLMQNFNSPYLSSSFSMFWSRWHISLSSWFKEYLYKPLGGNRRGQLIRYRNVFIVFLLSGFWHGAKWNFIIWGAIHGVLLILENALKRIVVIRIPNIIKVLLVFCTTTFAWIFFRANTLEDALLAFKYLATFSFENKLPVVFNTFELMFCFLLVGLLFYSEKKQWIQNLTKPAFQIIFTALLFVFCYLFGEFNLKQFIYFQF
jgi:D-alanyl-lipoteichoic acid acyltransferase DltB (MBOAT superfamily)